MPRVALTVISHPDPRRIGDRVLLGELDREGDVQVSRHRPPFERPGDPGVGRGLEDRWLSRRPVILRSVEAEGGGGEPSIAILAEGTRTDLRVDGVPVDDQISVPRQALEQGVVLTLARRIVLLLHRATPWPPGDLPTRHGLVGWSDALVGVRRAIDRVAPLDMPVLIQGATGTGKELVAAALHRASPRADGPFVAVNLGALSPSLAAAELFGSVKGAFTGADRTRNGFFGRAAGGTLFLDEIGEATPEVQVLLLRALETREIHPVGSSRPRRVDVRIVAATDADLAGQIAADRFRAPLLHRLASYEMHLPPLSQRRDDLGRLLRFFLDRELETLGASPLTAFPENEPWITHSLVEQLLAAPWPGNVRQLRNVARTLIAHRGAAGAFEEGSFLRLGEGPPSTDAAVGDLVNTTAEAGTTPSEHPIPTRRKPREIGEDEIRRALRAARWSVQAAARKLGIPRTSLASRIAQMKGVRTAAVLAPDEIHACFAETGGDVEAMVDALKVSPYGLRQRLRALGLIPRAGEDRGRG